MGVDGSDAEDCGLREGAPCRTLQKVLGQMGEGDVVSLDAAGSRDAPYAICDDVSMKIDHSFSLVGRQGLAVLGCTHNSLNDDASMRVAAAEGSDVTITMVNVTVVGLKIVLSDISLNMTACRFEDARLHVYSVLAPHVRAEVASSTWLGRTHCETGGDCGPTGEIKVAGKFKRFTMSDTHLRHTKVDLIASTPVDIRMTDCVFSNLPSEIPVHGGATITLGNIVRGNVTIERCVFRDQYHWNPIASVMNIFEASLLIRLMSKRNSFESDGNNITVEVLDTIFENNERGMTLQGTIEKVRVDNCVFKDNIAMHAGAGILILTNRSMTVSNSVFENNAAGNFRITQVRNEGDHFAVVGDEVQIHSKCCKGSISLIGKGGAMRVQKGDVTLINCRMKNNTARLLGGAVFVDRIGVLQFTNVTFSNSPDHIHASQGDILYSNGKVAVRGGVLVVKSSSNHISVLQHSGEHWSIAVHDITIQCPIGHRLRIMNTSAYGVTPFVGLRRSYMLDQLSYFCESCPRHKYSTDRGYLRYKLDHGVYEYFTLMINGESPNSDFHGTYDYHDIFCMECPYGAECDQTIRALPNFWGYTHEGGIKFQLTPKGYSCSKKRCPSFNTCAANREDRLCCACKANFSEALFSSMCVSNDTCGPVWIWPFAASLGVIYALFLLFQKDIREFIFSRPAQCQSGLCFKTRRGASVDSPQQRGYLRENGMLNGHHDDLQNHEHHELTSDLETHSDAMLALQEKIDKEGGEGVEGGGGDGGTEKAEEGEGEADQPIPDPGAIFLIILLYYFQDALLFNVKTVFSQAESKSWSYMRAVILGFFKFRLEVAHFVDNVCLYPGLTPWQKLLIKTLLVPYVLLLFSLLYIFAKCYSLSRPKPPPPAADGEDGAGGGGGSTLMVRLTTGFMLALLFMYQRLATTAFTLLNCVPVSYDHVLFIDGRVVCYEYWQYGVMAYAFCCIVPFCFVLLIGPGLLKDGLIGLPQFFMACILPLPFIIYWVALRLCRRQRPLPADDRPMTAETEAVYKVLQLPFKDIEGKYLGPKCWAGVLIARRLILFLIFTFVNNSLIRVLGMLFVCFLYLLHHVHVHPYKDPRGNMAGSASLSAMMVVGGINLVRAGFEAAEYVPQGPNKVLMRVMDETENILMLWFPLIIMCVVLLALVIKLFFVIFGCVTKHRR